MSNISLPLKFSWKQYIFLNKDLTDIKTKKEAIIHYMLYGKKENREYRINKSNYKLYLPSNFNWRNYLQLNKDLIYIKNKKGAIIHYILYGKNRKYNKETIKKNNENLQLIKNNIKPHEYEKNIFGKKQNKKDEINSFTNKDENYITDNISIDENTYDFLEDKNILYTKIYNHNENEKYLSFESDLNILDSLTDYNLIIDTNNIGNKSTILINTIVSKYKNYSTFLILRYDNEKYYLNINEEYLINQFFLDIDELIKFLNHKIEKINKVFINGLMGFENKLIDYIFSLPIFKIGLTNDFYDYYKQSTNEKNTNLIEDTINPHKYDLVITPNSFNLKKYNSFYKTECNIISFPDFKYKYKRITTFNKEIVCCIIGNINDLKGKIELENIILHFSEKHSMIHFVVLGNIDSKINIESKSYNNINEFNKLLEKYSPNIIIELSNYSTSYSYTLQLSILTSLPILYLNKSNDTYIKNKLNNYENAYPFENMDSLFYLINKHSQDYFYTILPIVTFNKFWNKLWIKNTELISSKNETNFKYNIKPFFIYYPQFHEIIENNIIFYKSHNDIKDLKYYNEKNIIKLNIPQVKYCEVENYEYIVNDELIQKQMNIINDLNFHGIAIYYYWFMINSFSNNHMIMEKVIDKLFSSEINMYDKKIFFIWKNESWSNIYNCNNRVIENAYNNSCFYTNSENLVKYFLNDKYLKIDNKPVFIVNDTHLIENIDVFHKILNKICIENNFSGVNLILNSNIDKEYSNYKNCNNNFNCNIISKYTESNNDENIINYEKYINDDSNIDSKKIQTITLDFNNKANIKKQTKNQIPYICKDNTEMLKIIYIKKIVESYNKSLQTTDLDKILLINSFNNWGESTSFEPSEKYGYYNINLLEKLLKN